MSREDDKVVLGKLLVLTTEINEKVSRLVWRVDNLEDRLESLEKNESAGNFRQSLIDKALWGLVAAGVVYFLNGGLL